MSFCLEHTRSEYYLSNLVVFSYDFNFALYVGGNSQKNGVKIHFTLHMVSCSTKHPRIDSRLHKLSFSHVIWGKYVLHTRGIGQAAGVCGKWAEKFILDKNHKNLHYV